MPNDLDSPGQSPSSPVNKFGRLQAAIPDIKISRDSNDFTVNAIAKIDSVPLILEVACKLTGMRFAAIARVTENSWTACALRDEINFGLAPGDQLDVTTTICNEIRKSGIGVIIDDVENDEHYKDHPTARLYGFKSYISMPIIRTDGSFFGTLCALDLLPAKLSDPGIAIAFKLFAELIALHLDGVESVARSKAALLDSQETAVLREQFIAVLGHDLRNPVAAINSGTNILLMSGKLDEANANVVTMMRQSCLRMAGLINDVLDFARGRLGDGLSIERQPGASLETVLDHVIAEVGAAHPNRRITTSVDLQHGLTCEPARIGQLLANLLANAVVHGNPAYPVDVSATCTGGLFRMSVANHGDPIPAKKRPKLFQPFSRAGDNKPDKGLGLGLYIAAEIAKAHNGVITVDSTIDRTVFTFTMSNVDSVLAGAPA